MFKYRNNAGRRILDASKEAICERICTTYVETGRTVRSLAGLYGCSKTTVHNYLYKYAQDCVSYSLYQAVRRTAKENMQQVYLNGQSDNKYSEDVGSYD